MLPAINAIIQPNSNVIVLLGQPIPVAALVIAAALAIAITGFTVVRNGRSRRLAEDEILRAGDAERSMAELLRVQAEMQGRLATIAEVFGSRQSEFNQAVNQRLDGMSQRVSTTIHE